MFRYLPDIMENRLFSDAWDSSIWPEFMAAGLERQTTQSIIRERNKTGFRASRMLQVIGDALKLRLCRADMIFERECEEV